jgi:predicted nucleotidyltransferase
MRVDPRFARLDEALRREFPGLELLWLHGSRARGDATASSDWDIGFVGDAVDSLELASVLAAHLHADVDLVDLSRANGLLRYRAALEGCPLFERQPHAGGDFAESALRFWYDAGPIIEAEYAARLARLRP